MSKKMVKKLMRLISLIFLLFINTIIRAEKIAEFPDILRPHQVLIDRNELFILEQYKVNLYSLKPFKLKISFGKKGEGPGEFKSRVRIAVNREYVIANSRGKFSYFNRKGKLIKEIKNNRLVTRVYLTKNKLIGRALKPSDNFESFSEFLIFNSEGTVIKKICSRKLAQFRSKSSPRIVLDDYFPELNIVCKTTCDRICISGKRGFTIDIYNEKGIFLKSIVRKYKRRKISSSDRNKMLKFYEDPWVKRNWHNLKNIIKIPDYFPYYYLFLITADKLWVQTFKKKGEKTEFLIFDLKGNFRGIIYLPLAYKDYFTPFLYHIHDDVLYQLVLNEDTDIYELHQVKIDQLKCLRDRRNICI